MIKREEALLFLKENLNEVNLVKHSLACEAAMIALADHFQEDREKWGLSGLLHDIDYEQTKNNPEKHSLIGSQMILEYGFNSEIAQAVKTHNFSHGILPDTKMAKALYCLDSLTGLIVAATLVLPEKKISLLNKENVLNRFKEKSFARGARREEILKCEELLGLSLVDFIDIALKAMQGISEELGL